MDESKKCWELLNNIGYDVGFRPEDYPNRFIYALNDRGNVYSVPVSQEEEYKENYWSKKQRIYFKELFAPKIPLSEELIQDIVNEFKKLGATNEDTGLNFIDLEKETKIEIGHCYDLVDLGILGVYHNRFYLLSKNNNNNNNLKETKNPKNKSIVEKIIDIEKEEEFIRMPVWEVLFDDVNEITKNKPKPIKVDNKGNYL